MDLGYSEEQNLIAQQAREFFTRECPLDKVREFWALQEGLPDGLWGRMAELGWLGALFEESVGGMALTHTDLSRILEEMGRDLLPGPYLGHLLGGYAVHLAGSEAQRTDWLPKVASGELRLTLARFGEGGRADRLGGVFRMEKVDAGYRISGEKLAVPGLAQAHRVLVVAQDAGGKPTLLAVPTDLPGVIMKPLDSLDGGLKQASLKLEQVIVEEQALLPGCEADTLQALDCLADLALAFDALGGAARVMEMSVEYARVRTAFGQPIATYQAIKHKCADMLYAVENLRAIASWAGWVMDVSLDGNGTERGVAAAMARATAIETYDLVIRHGTQIHGAIGVTEEHDLHLFAKRAKTLALSFGSLPYYQERILAGSRFFQTAPAGKLG